MPTERSIMRLSIPQTQFVLNRVTIVSIAMLLSVGCTITKPVTITSVSKVTANGNNCIDILGRSLKATKTDNNNYIFKEEISYTANASNCTQNELSIRKTICVDKDCKTSKKHKLNGKNNKMRISFIVNEVKMDEKFTIITEISLKDSKIKTYGYEFYPRKCLEKACKE